MVAGNLQRVRFDRIKPRPDQPRQRFDDEAIKRLADSIREDGLLQPIIVTPADADGTHRIIAGERRYRAANIAELESIPCLIHEGGDLDMLAVAENIHRADLTASERAGAYRRLMDANDWTQADLADRLNVPRGTIAKTLRLTELPDAVTWHVDKGYLNEAAGHELLRLQLLDRAATQPPDPVRYPSAKGRWAWLWALGMTCGANAHRDYAAVRAHVDQGLAAMELLRRHGSDCQVAEALAAEPELTAAEEGYEAALEDDDWSPVPLHIAASMLAHDLRPDFDRLSHADGEAMSRAFDRYTGMLMSGRTFNLRAVATAGGN